MHASTTRLALDEVEAADALGVSPRFLAELRADGAIPFVRLGKRILYPIHGLVAWMTAIMQNRPQSLDGGE